ncbi:putative anucleate primary sterigmata protein b [Phaeomoniella chlamydospora]|uniref:Putative anucleate primary sterigmata protein b n=1 Tax=Phaeomoniella chlamydospora TaxID=158046 RepID=A0A0G2H8W6_PHACM|nr:putative anucleate primary sterigmata protein b [Phaeomoniella chlamydospora]
MSSSPASRPTNTRKPSRLPGGFDDDYDEYNHANEEDDSRQYGYGDSSDLPPLPNDSSILPSNEENSRGVAGQQTMLEERDMNHKLLDVESSFLPEVSHLAPAVSNGADDTYMFGVPNDNLAKRQQPVSPVNTRTGHGQGEDEFGFRSPKTPPETYKTPGPERQEEELARRREAEGGEPETPGAPNTSSLETLSSSPTAAAAARTVSRVISMASLGGYETANERDSPESPTRQRRHREEDDPETTPRKSQDRHLDLFAESQSTAGGALVDQDSGLDNSTEFPPEKQSRRPKYLQSRQSSQRLSQSSFISGNTDTASEATMGADFALQSGGAAPGGGPTRKSKILSRATSLGSMASGISALSDEEGFPTRKQVSGGELETLNEEDRPASRRQADSELDVPLTPKASAHNLLPTDTVIANNVRDIEVPGTFARQYRQAHRTDSPGKTPFAATPLAIRAGKSMTLKEHRSTVDRLGKENFDLKMKIHFLDQALQRRSEDGIKEMITENVQLKSDKVRLEKDNHGLRKSLRDLEKKLKDRDSGDTVVPEKDIEDEERLNEAEEEVLWLREQVETYEVEIRKMRTDMMSRESEKRRLAEVVKSLGEARTTGTSDVGSREERDMWKDMLEAETAAREQADDENKRLREEVEALRAEAVNLSKHSTRRGNTRFSSGASQASSLDRDRDVSGSQAASSTTLVELDRLRHENSELQKVISAQTSTLTSRNKEKERLYQEIEDLKLGQRRGDGRSVAGDSIFERSASRVRSHSRMSNGTRMSRASDNERENLEIKNGELRDQVSELKLESQNLRNKLDEVNAELDAIDAQAQADADQFNEELHLLSLERDDALRAAEELDEAFQQLKAEAQEEIDGLGDELDLKIQEAERLENDLRNQEENFRALQGEMRSATEGIIRLEEDAQANVQRYKAVRQELEDSNRELEALEKSLAESNSKIQRLTVQQESSHNEIAFLREEQDADKIKIGDLEAALKTTTMSLHSEKDKTQELETRLAEERYQREVVGSKEKQEVQRIMNDLNREASASRDDARRLKKALSTRDIELASWKDRLTELENSLRDLLGDPQGTRATFLNAIARLQKGLESTSMELDSTRQALDEKAEIVADRDRLLEMNGLEFRKMLDVLEKERNAHRADKHSFEQTLKSHQQATRSISQSNTRISELEAARQGDRKKFLQAESQYKDQLAERNSVLLQLWKKLSTMCGPDWAHSNSLINGNLPSQEVVGNMLFWPGFSRNLLLAAKQVESTIGIFKERIKRTERDLWKEYQALEHTLDLRVKKLDRVEEIVTNMRAAQRPTSRHEFTSASPDLNKLKGENRLLKAELALMQQQHQRGSSGQSIPPRGSSSRPSGGGSQGSMVGHGTLMRHHTSNVVEHLTTESDRQQSLRSNSVSSSRASSSARDIMLPEVNQYPNPNNPGNQPGQDKWIHRLRELERRLKKEREARLQDRSGARKRLEERDAVNEELRLELERERMRKETGIVGVNATAPSISGTPDVASVRGDS